MVAVTAALLRQPRQLGALPTSSGGALARSVSRPGSSPTRRFEPELRCRLVLNRRSSRGKVVVSLASCLCISMPTHCHLLLTIIERERPIRVDRSGNLPVQRRSWRKPSEAACPPLAADAMWRSGRAAPRSRRGRGDTAICGRGGCCAHRRLARASTECGWLVNRCAEPSRSPQVARADAGTEEAEKLPVVASCDEADGAGHAFPHRNALPSCARDSTS